MRVRLQRMVPGLIVVVSIFGVTPGAAAQVAEPPLPTAGAGALGDEPKQRRQWRVGGFVGVAQNSPIAYGLGLGATPGRDHLFIGVQAQTTVLNIGALRVSYGVQVVPALVVRGRTAPLGYSGVFDTDRDGLIPGRNHAYAFGVAPFSLEVAAPVGRRIGVYAATTAGLLMFTRPFPVPEAQQANFSMEFGGGVLVRTGTRHWIQAGYKYHHLSNAYYNRVNPGLDAHVVYVGYWRALGGRP